nr:MAG TPA: hypothetical protein [Caudoviricetes sp.]
MLAMVTIVLFLCSVEVKPPPAVALEDWKV